MIANDDFTAERYRLTFIMIVVVAITGVMLKLLSLYRISLSILPGYELNKAIALTLAGLVIAGAQYFLVFEDAPHPLRILAPSLIAISFFLIGLSAGRG